MIIGLNGKLKSGKDTTFDIIKGLVPEAERVSFAEPLKDSAAAALGMSRELMEFLKNHEQIHIELPSGFTLSQPMPSYLKGEAMHWNLNLREYLQRYGTEAHRDIFGENFWVDMALPLNLDHQDRYLVVTDARFPNEVDRIKMLGGYLVKVIRETETAHGDHPSEQNLDEWIDYTLDNTGTIDDLKTQVSDLLERITRLDEQFYRLSEAEC